MKIKTKVVVLTMFLSLFIPLKSYKAMENTNQHIAQIDASAVTYQSIEVNTPAELEIAVSSAVNNTQILLGASFPTTLDAAIKINLTQPIDLVIDGQGLALQVSSIARHFELTNSSTGTITIQNLNLVGRIAISDSNVITGASGGGIKINGKSNSQTITNIINMTFTNIKGGAIELKTNESLVVVNSLFKDNAFMSGAAIVASEQPRNLEVRSSTFIHNIATDSGYDGGAIFIKQQVGDVTISNSYFEKNISTYGRGGAVSINYLKNGTETLIENSYFDDNHAVGNNDKSDGGAIALYEVDANAKAVIKSSTFSNNTASDDGGALLLQSLKGRTISVENSTFYNNESYGIEGSIASTSFSGGAIQTFSNAGFLGLAEFDFVNNTFYGNASYGGNDTTEQRGGAIAGSGSSASITRYYMTNNLFNNNQVFMKNGTEIKRNYSNIAVANHTSKNNIGIDNGTLNATTTLEAFGYQDIQLTQNESKVVAGRYQEARIVPTIPFIPTIALADQGGVAALTVDQRGLPRPSNLSDIGAVENSSIKYDANGGYLVPDAQPLYTEYYLNSNRQMVQPVVYGYQVVVKQDITVMYDDMRFVEWNTQADGNGISYQGNEVIDINEPVTLYAIWTPIQKFQITYHANEATSGQVPQDLNRYLDQDKALILDALDLQKEGYEFSGWNTSPTGDGVQYNVNDEITVSADLNLYAMWTIKKVTIDFIYNGGQVINNDLLLDLDLSDQADIYSYIVDYGTTIQSIPVIEKEGYDFKGWDIYVDGTYLGTVDQNLVVISEGSQILDYQTYPLTSNMQLIASWSKQAEIFYTVVYHANGATGQAPTDDLLYVANTTATIKNQAGLQKDHYHFVGWSLDPKDFTQIINPDSQLVVTEDLVLYAMWQEDSYVIQYQLDGGINHPSNPDFYIYASGLKQLFAPSKSGYVFKGWSLNSMEGPIVTQITTTQFGDIILYAHWQKETVVIEEGGNTDITTPVVPTTPEDKTTPAQLPNTGIANDTMYMALGMMLSGIVLTIISKRKKDAN